MRARAAASLALVAVAALALAGCSLFMAPETQIPYDPSDGTNADIGALQLRNVLVVTEDGEDGNLVMTVVNTGDDDLEVTLQYESDGAKRDVTIEAAANSTTSFGSGDSGQLLLEGIETPAGDLLPLYVQYGDEPGEQLQVPVVDGTIPPYDMLLPTPKPTPTPTPTPSPTGTPEA